MEVASDKKILFKKLHNPLITWIDLVTRQAKKRYISISTTPVAPKLDRMVAYDKESQT